MELAMGSIPCAWAQPLPVHSSLQDTPHLPHSSAPFSCGAVSRGWGHSRGLLLALRCSPSPSAPHSPNLPRAPLPIPAPPFPARGAAAPEPRAVSAALWCWRSAARSGRTQGPAQLGQESLLYCPCDPSPGLSELCPPPGVERGRSEVWGDTALPWQGCVGISATGGHCARAGARGGC